MVSVMLRAMSRANPKYARDLFFAFRKEDSESDENEYREEQFIEQYSVVYRQLPHLCRAKTHNMIAYPKNQVI